MRLIIGLILVLGGVGGMEQNMETLFPLDSIGVIIVGLGLMTWFVYDQEENDYDY
jgi:hypothetical protein